jgi:hypothetical protein
LKIYGTIVDVNVEERTKATIIYNLAAAWMNVDSDSLSIEICRIGKYVESKNESIFQNLHSGKNN